MAEGRVQIDGLRQLGEALRELGDVTARKICGQGTGAAARIVRDAAKRNLEAHAVRTGLVRDNVIAKKLSKNRTSLTAAHIVTTKKVKYATDNKQGKRNTKRSAAALELGTVNMDKEPWLGPALTTNRSRAEQAMKQALQRGIKREVNRIGRK